MKISHLTHYRNLETWSKEDWENLDVHLFIVANFNRYCSLMLKRIGMQHLPSDATETLLGVFCDVAYRPLRKLHSRYIHVEGGRRNQIMLGSLKKITTTRVLQAVIREFPTHISIEKDDNNQDRGGTIGTALDNPFGYTPQIEDTLQHSTNAYYAAGSADENAIADEYELHPDDINKSQMVENLRAHLTSVQYIHLRYVICDGLDAHEIAQRTGHSVTNVRIMLLNARKSMLKLVPDHLHQYVEKCIYRRQPNAC